jgi:hypothetical protein
MKGVASRFTRLYPLVGAVVMAWTVAACAPTLSPVEVRDRLVQTVSVVADTPIPALPPPSPTASPTVERSATRRITRLTPIPRTPTPRLLPQPLPVVEPGATPGEVPEDLLRAIVNDLAARLEVTAEAVTLVRAEFVVWPDGSLGCPQPGFVYTQALVPGYRVVLQVGGQDYDYRVGQGGYFVLCERSLPGQVFPP